MDEIAENGKKVFKMNENKYDVLLINQNGNISAVGTKCTHYGAPLVNGALGNGRIRCPWHGACFNIKTGDVEDFPAFDALPCYEVRIDESKNVIVKARKDELEMKKRTKKTLFSKSGITDDSLHYIIIGGGAAGQAAAETLRESHFSGKITLICKESVYPYDRVKYSKSLDFNILKAQLRDEDFYKDSKIDVLLDTEVVNINTEKNIIYLNSKDILNFDKLLIATGSVPRFLSIPGCNSPYICTLRTFQDAQHLNSLLSADKKVTIFGSGFIGMEIAANIVCKVAKVTVLSRTVTPFLSVFGSEIGYAVQALFKKKGVEFLICKSLKEFKIDENNHLTHLELDDGTLIETDICVVAIGTYYRNDFLKNSSLEFHESGAIDVDQFCRTNLDHVYAAGDIAFAPIPFSEDLKASIGHFGISQYMGKVAALNMLGKREKLQSVPYFWTSFFGKSIRYVGFGGFDDVVIHGEVEDLHFLACFIRGDRVVAMASCGWDPVVSQYAEFVSAGKVLNKEQVFSIEFVQILESL